MKYFATHSWYSGTNSLWIRHNIQDLSEEEDSKKIMTEQYLGECCDQYCYTHQKVYYTSMHMYTKKLVLLQVGVDNGSMISAISYKVICYIFIIYMIWFLKYLRIIFLKPLRNDPTNNIIWLLLKHCMRYLTHGVHWNKP